MSDLDDLRAYGVLTEDGALDLRLIYGAIVYITKELGNGESFEKILEYLYKLLVDFGKYARVTELCHNDYSVAFLMFYSCICSYYAEMNYYLGIYEDALLTSSTAVMINPNPWPGLYEKCNEIATNSANKLGIPFEFTAKEKTENDSPTFQRCARELSDLLSRGLLP